MVELAVCVAEEGAGVLGSELGLGPLAEDDRVGEVWRLRRLQYYSRELHALLPEWLGSVNL